MLGRLHSGLHPDQVTDVGLQALIQGDQKIVGRHRLGRHRIEILLKRRGGRQFQQVGRQFVRQRGVVFERDFLGVRLEKKVEGIDDRHFGHQVHLDPELTGLLRKHQARQVIALRILLPVDEMIGRRDIQGIGEDRGARMGGRAQAHDLRPEIDQAVVTVVGDMAQGDVD